MGIRQLRAAHRRNVRACLKCLCAASENIQAACRLIKRPGPVVIDFVIVERHRKGAAAWGCLKVRVGLVLGMAAAISSML